MASKKEIVPNKDNGTIVYTLAACCRCRSRKTRCDTGLPRCHPCERNNTRCEYLEAKGQYVPRSYVVYLQKKVKELQATLSSLGQEENVPADAESTVRGAGFVQFKEHDEPRILGPSSGIAVTRLVMEFAKENLKKKSIKEIIPEMKARQIRDRFVRERDKPTSKVYPLISDVAAPHLPTRELTNNLVEIFNRKAQYMLPTLHEPSFWGIVDDVYNGDGNPYKNFTLRMVIAVSMQKLDTQYAGLADSYYLAALPFLEDVIRMADLGTLQCFALIAQYSLLTPTRTAAYYVVGLATRLCQELGMAEENTIGLDPNGERYLSPLEIDMRRRLFWIITSMELGLAHSLGRPNAFGTTFDHISVGFFAAVDDVNITSSGIVTGPDPSTKKFLAIHFFKMRLLQAEIRRKLYLKKRLTPADAEDPWFAEMEKKLQDWMDLIPKSETLGGDWYKQVRYNTMLILLHRPSPQVPSPTFQSARRCFHAAVYNIQRLREQILARTIDLTWVVTQALYMGLNTILWSLSYPKVREENKKEDVEINVSAAVQTIIMASERWPGVESAIELYEHLIVACLASYDMETESSPKFSASSSFTAGHPQKSPIRSTPHPFTPESMATPETIPPCSTSSVSGTEDPIPNHAWWPTEQGSHQTTPEIDTSPSIGDIGPQDHNSNIHGHSHSHLDQAFLYNQLPLPDLVFDEKMAPSQLDDDAYLGLIGEQYSHYLHAPSANSYPMQTLNKVQQMELMMDLENVGLGIT